jgi:hypothetical protein
VCAWHANFARHQVANDGFSTSDRVNAAACAVCCECLWVFVVRKLRDHGDSVSPSTNYGIACSE